MEWLESQLLELERKERAELKQLVRQARQLLAERLLRHQGRQVEVEIYAVLVWLMAALRDVMLQYEEAAYRLGYYATAWQADILPAQLDSGFVRDTLQKPYIDATLTQRLSDLENQYTPKFRRRVTQSELEEESFEMMLLALNDIWGLKKTAQALWASIWLLGVSELWRAGNDGVEYAIDVVPPDLMQGKQWVTAGDERVCPICGKVHMEIKPMGSLFSNGFYRPPAHARCRCLLRLLVNVVNEMGYRQWASKNSITPEEDGTKLI